MWNRIIGLVGPSGSGKSHKAAELMLQCERAAVYQIVHEDTNYLAAATDVFVGDIRSFCRSLGENQFRYIYKSGEPLQEKNKIYFPDFDIFIAACFERKNMAMFVDEAHFLCSPRYIPVSLWQSVITGRHMYLDIVYVTQRFSMVHHDITANTHEFYFWKITEPSDLEALQQRCGQEVREQVANLRATEDNRRHGGSLIPGELLHWSK